ncbi:restriction endonuclease subunit S [Mastigocladopsis repens]|uniref:restriction endonuclease subunit S n=1 Tax=Mastigocladopsis repens TaxID=221287 RepID=UPI0018DE5FD1|nr:restriction endonuclease subunit S [Mastigocladopsis repens]
MGENSLMIWVRRTLGEICDEVKGIIRTEPFGSQLHQSDYQDEGLPVVMPKDIIDAKISVEGIARIGEKDVERLAQHRLKKGDIVYGRRGDIGRRALINDREAGWLCGTGCLRISLGNSVLNPNFLYYYLGESKVIAWIYNQAVGATLANLNTTIIRSIPITYPPLPTQKKITAILSAYDDLIENNTRRIKILEEMAQTLYHEWFVKFRFPGHEQTKMVDSELGLIPEGWEVKKLSDICNITMGQSPKSEFYNQNQEGLPFHQGVTDFGDRFPIDRIFCTVQNRIAEAGDILFSVRAPVGRINLANKKIIIGRGLCAIRSKSANQLFVFQQLKDKFQEEDLMGGGTIFKSVTKEDMHNLKIVAPNSILVQSFEKFVQPIFRNLEILTEKNLNLCKTRDLLLPKLISGEIDVEHLDINTTEDVAA